MLVICGISELNAWKSVASATEILMSETVRKRGTLLPVMGHGYQAMIESSMALTWLSVQTTIWSTERPRHGRRHGDDFVVLVALLL